VPINLFWMIPVQGRGECRERPEFQVELLVPVLTVLMGVPTMVISLVPKTTAATTAATATIVPATALRTGTAVRPRPGSNAIRTPTLPGTDPARPATRPTATAGPARPARPPPPPGRPPRT
jgi:hypothetical protein